MGDYFRVRLMDVPSADSDDISSLCFAHGCAGVSEDLDFSQPHDHYEPVTLTKKVVALDVYFVEEPPNEFFRELEKEFPRIAVHTSREPQKDWLAEWKKGFESFVLVGDVWIVPSWCEAPMQAQKIIRIDPGMAFGTGTHATTQLAAELMSFSFQERVPGRLLDVGTGTGILAMLAQLWGCPEITAVEIDEPARAVARENIQLNQADRVRICDEPVEALRSPYSVVVANIIDGVLLKLRASLTRLTQPGEHLILTGILDDHNDEFLPHWQADFDVIKTQAKDEWVGHLLRRKS